MATTAVIPAVNEIEKTYKYLDFNTFTEVSETVKVAFSAAKSTQEAVQRMDNDEKKILTALNAALQRAAFTEARKSLATKGVPKKLVLGIIKPWRSLEPYASIVERAEQTKALLEAVRQNPMLVESIKATALKMAEEGADDEGPDEDN